MKARASEPRSGHSGNETSTESSTTSRRKHSLVANIAESRQRVGRRNRLKLLFSNNPSDATQQNSPGDSHRKNVIPVIRPEKMNATIIISGVDNGSSSQDPNKDISMRGDNGQAKKQSIINSITASRHRMGRRNRLKLLLAAKAAEANAKNQSLENNSNPQSHVFEFSEIPSFPTEDNSASPKHRLALDTTQPDSKGEEEDSCMTRSPHYDRNGKLNYSIVIL